MQNAATPNPPAFLPAKAAKAWSDTYVKALAQAKLDSPDNERAQRIFALKTANALLRVPAPASAADIDKLEAWQKIKDDTLTVDGIQTRVCVTSDGRKYSFEVTAPAPASTSAGQELQAMNKAQIVAHALEVHGLELDPNLKKDELIAAVAAKAAQ